MFDIKTFTGLVQADDVNDDFTLHRIALKPSIEELNRNPMQVNMVAIRVRIKLS